MKNIILTLLLSTQIQAATEHGITFSDSLKTNDKTLVLNGLGTRMASMLGLKFKVYVAGLYLEKKSQKASDIIASDSPKKINMEFLRDVSKEKMIKSWEEGYSKNCADKCSSHQSHLQKYLSFMTDVKEKDKLSLTFLPDRLVFQINENESQIITNAEFADIILSVFIGQNPPNEELRDGLLGVAK